MRYNFHATALFGNLEKDCLNNFENGVCRNSYMRKVIDDNRSPAAGDGIGQIFLLL